MGFLRKLSKNCGLKKSSSYCTRLCPLNSGPRQSEDRETQALGGTKQMLWDPDNLDFRILVQYSWTVTGLYCMPAYLTQTSHEGVPSDDGSVTISCCKSDRCPSKAACGTDIEDECSYCLLAVQCLLIGRREGTICSRSYCHLMVPVCCCAFLFCKCMYMLCCSCSSTPPYWGLSLPHDSTYVESINAMVKGTLDELVSCCSWRCCMPTPSELAPCNL